MVAVRTDGVVEQEERRQAAWDEHDRCEESRRRLEACPRGTGARKRRRDDCILFDRIARTLHPGYPRCIEPGFPRPGGRAP